MSVVGKSGIGRLSEAVERARGTLASGVGGAIRDVTAGKHGEPLPKGYVRVSEDVVVNVETGDAVMSRMG